MRANKTDASSSLDHLSLCEYQPPVAGRLLDCPAASLSIRTPKLCIKDLMSCWIFQNSTSSWPHFCFPCELIKVTGSILDMISFNRALVLSNALDINAVLTKLHSSSVISCWPSVMRRSGPGVPRGWHWPWDQVRIIWKIITSCIATQESYRHRAHSNWFSVMFKTRFAQVRRVSTWTGRWRFSMVWSLHRASAYFRKQRQSVGRRCSGCVIVDPVVSSSRAATVSREIGLLVSKTEECEDAESGEPRRS